MNTNPDKIQIQLWLEDELTGEEFKQMEAWATNHPQQLAAREELRNFKIMIRTHLPAEEELPFPDFFLSRVKKGIIELEKKDSASLKKTFIWKNWFMPMAACACCLLAFGLGKWSGSPHSSLVDSTSLYTPENGVEAKWSSNSKNQTPVIVLEGVHPIPNSTELSGTAHTETDRESDRTATYKPNPNTLNKP